ncbi:uncharacterized protein METZ01_LOCUS309948 [marine metagenome]|uniref:Uncharacterized protein n=1 Tax=marine metagenome TaxID=408172 RepID=A0A382N7E0_9ZZZZ
MIGCKRDVRIYNGNFHTENVRILWQICADTFRLKRPDILPHVFFPICDCYLDQVRKSLKPEQMKQLSDKESIKLGIELMEACKYDGKPLIKT